MPRLKPNSREWLDTLAKEDEHQARITEAAVRMAGSEEVCSICGDTPALEYEDPRSEAAVTNIMLCDDCWHIQMGMGARLARVAKE